MTYQIPSDLLQGDGVEEVRRLVAAIDATIAAEKARAVVPRPPSAKEGGM